VKQKLALTSLRKDQLKFAKNFALYYGYGESRKLSKYDMAIIEPKGMTEEDISYMKNKKTLILSYLSMVEVHPSEPIFNTLREEDFLYIDDEIARNTVFGTYLVDLSSKRWIEHLLSEVEYRLIYMDSDGIFLDTIGDLELSSIPNLVREEQIQSAMNILTTIKKKFPQHLLIQNNGLEYLCERTAPFIDGILWENPPLSLKESEEWVKVIMARLEALQENFGLRLFMLFEETVEQVRNAYPIAKRVGEEKNYLIYSAPAHYTTGVRT
jgi:hypothetical protein